jgi:hypothetical protein
MSISLFVQILGWVASVALAFLLGNVLRPFLNSYSSEKGKNRATKEDIADLTRIVEGIKAEISEGVWDRQRQRELKRDVIVETLRDLSVLDACVNNVWQLWNGVSAPTPAEVEQRFQRIYGPYSECHSMIKGSISRVRCLAGKNFADKLDALLNKVHFFSVLIVSQDERARSKEFKLELDECKDAVHTAADAEL